MYQWYTLTLFVIYRINFYKLMLFPVDKWTFSVVSINKDHNLVPVLETKLCSVQMEKSPNTNVSQCFCRMLVFINRGTWQFLHIYDYQRKGNQSLQQHNNFSAEADKTVITPQSTEKKKGYFHRELPIQPVCDMMHSTMSVS